MKMLAILLCGLMASLAAAQEKLSMILDTGDKSMSQSPLAIAHAFKAVPNAEYFGVIAGPKTYTHAAFWLHSNMADFGSGPQSTGGWLGFSYDGVVYFPSSMPLKPALGTKAYLPFGGDSARGFAEWMWCFDGVLSGQCETGRTYREKNVYFQQKIFTGADAVKRFIIDFRGTNIQTAPLTRQAPYNFADIALTKYRKDFSVPNATGKCKDKLGVDSSGVPTWLIGMSDPQDANKTIDMVKLVDSLLAPAVYVVDVNDAQQITATASVAGAARTYALATVTMNGQLAGAPCFTPQQFAGWLGSVDYPGVVIQCNSPTTGQNDCIAVANALAGLLSGQ